MQRYMPCILIAVGLLLCTSLAAAADTLRVGYFTKKPVAMQDNNGEPAGLVVDVISDIAENQAWGTTWIHGSFAQGVNRLDAGEIDLMVPLAYTPARDVFLDFSEEGFLQSWGCLYTPRGSLLRSIPDAAGKRIAYVKKSMLVHEFDRLIQGFHLECELIEVPGYTELLQGVIAGHYDGGIGDRLAMTSLAQKQAAHIDSSIVFSPFGLRAAVREGDPKRLLPLIDDYLLRGRIDSDSAYNRYLEKWLTGVAAREDKRTVMVALLFGILFLGFSGYLTVQLPAVRRMMRIETMEENRVAANALVAAGLLGGFLYLADALAGYLWFNAAGKSFFSILLPLDDLGALMMRAMFCGAILVAGIVTSRVLGLLAGQQRITSEMAENLRLGEEKYRSLLHKIQAAVVVHADNTKIKVANPKAEELLGLSQDQLLGRSAINSEWHFLNSDGDKLSIERYPINQVLRNRQPLRDYTMGIIHPDGRDIVWVLVNADPTFDDEGNIHQVIVTFVDITERRIAEMALRESEEKFRLYMENAHDGVLIVGSDFNFEYANSELGNILGYPLDEIIGHPYTSFLDEESVNIVTDRHQRRQKGEDVPSRYEFTIIRKDGEKRDVEISVGITKDSKGDVKTMGSLLDITDRKKAEKEIRNAYKIINRSPYVAFLWENAPGWPVAYVSENAGALFGHSAEDFISAKTTFAETVHPDDLDRVAKEVRHNSAEEDRTDFVHQPYRIVTRTGEIKWVNDLTRIRRDPQGAISHYEGIVYDITDRKKAEEELNHLRNYMANIIDSMPSVLIGVDRDGNVTQWNSQAQRATGLSSQKAVGQPLDKAFPRLSAEMQRVHQTMAARQVRTDSRQARHEKGEMRYEDVTVYPLTANGVEGAVIRVDDVTDRVRIEEMMVQSEKMLSVGGLAAGMAHEINNPLAGMIQNASVMANRLTSPDLPANRTAAADAGTNMAAIGRFMQTRGILRMLENIRQSGGRAAEIVANMLSFARKGNTAFTTHDLAELLDQTVDLAGSDYDLKKKFDFRQIEIVREYAADVPPVPCEAAKIQQVLLNLLRNGAEAMQAYLENESRKSEDGKSHQPRFTLRLAHEKETGMARIEVEDNGPGMEAATRKRVFEPFFTTKTTEQGTGLGLSVSYFIIAENHGGKMAVVSSPGNGTTFTIWLPVDARHPSRDH